MAYFISLDVELHFKLYETLFFLWTQIYLTEICIVLWRYIMFAPDFFFKKICIEFVYDKLQLH